jgi:hypothetical protein
MTPVSYLDTHLVAVVIIINMLMPVKLHSFTHLRARLALHHSGIWAHVTTYLALLALLEAKGIQGTFCPVQGTFGPVQGTFSNV